MNSSLQTGIAFLACLIPAPAAFAKEKVIPLWPGVAPGSEDWTQKEVELIHPVTKERFIRNVVTPTLTVFLPSPDKATGAAVIICPGGAFRVLSWENEGRVVAEWLASRGVAAFVLKYRLVNTGETTEEFKEALKEMADEVAAAAKRGGDANLRSRRHPLDADNIIVLAVADGRKAMKVVQSRCGEWGIAPDRIGVMGFSAGCVIALGVVMDEDRENRPAFAATIYGGDTGESKVPVDAPPLFIAVANDDPFAAAGSIRLFSEWRAAKRPVELHVYSQGGHGYSAKRGWPLDRWIDRFGDWLEVQGLLKAE